MFNVRNNQQNFINFSKNEDEYIIIDYKSTDYNLRNMWYTAEGICLQLPTDIMSLGENVVAAAYGIIYKSEVELYVKDL